MEAIAELYKDLQQFLRRTKVRYSAAVTDQVTSIYDHVQNDGLKGDMAMVPDSIRKVNA